LKNNDLRRKPNRPAQNPGDLPGIAPGKMKFPIEVTFRKAEAKIYGKSKAYPFYRVSHYAGRTRHVQSFSRYSEARASADEKVRDVANGNQAVALTAKEATAALWTL
jgi:hypothetical protein